MPGDEFDERYSGVPMPPEDWEGWKERKYQSPRKEVSLSMLNSDFLDTLAEGIKALCLTLTNGRPS